MSAVLSAKQICEQGLRNIGAFTVNDSAADGGQLRQAMTSLDLILAEEAGADRLFFLVPSTVSFTLTNGTPSYDLIGALGANAPADGFQFPIKAYLVEPSGSSVVGFSASVPGTVQVGQPVSDLTTASGVPPSTTVTAISGNQVTLSGPSVVVSGDTVQFNSSINLTATGTVNGTGQVAGTSLVRRHPIRIVTRDEFMASHAPDRTGRPEMVYIDRLPDNQIYFHPYPSATDPQLRILDLDVQTYAPNVAPAGVTGTQPQGSILTEFRQAWQRFLVYQLSHDLGSGAIFKIDEARLNRFGKIAETSRLKLEAFENREQDTDPPVCDANDYGEQRGIRDGRDDRFGYY